MDDADLTTRHVKAARALLEWNQEDLAAKAKVSIPTIRRLEAIRRRLADSALPETVASIRGALERAGIEFENGGAPGVRLKPTHKATASRKARKGR